VTFLPLVQRELRVASRRNRVFWLRSGAALAALLCMAPAVLIESVRHTGAAGALVFLSLSWFAFVLCILAGAFFASDCISRERRDGTLGFLFLSDLRGYDVVLGKFCAVSLKAVYSLLAVIPVLGLSLLGGGVTFAEFGRMSLALLNALFFALALGVFVSSRYRSNFQPTFMVLGLLILVIVGGVFASHFAGTAYASLPSLGSPFLLAPSDNYLYHQKDFWRALAASNAVGWLLLALAAWRLDVVHDSAEKPFLARFHRRRRRLLLDRNPVAWLLDDSSGLWTAALLTAIIGAPVSFLSASRPGHAHILFYAASPFYFVLKILCALQACRFFTESRANGALELLGATPLEPKDMIAGQWAALRRIFTPPFCLLVGANLLGCFVLDGFFEGIFSLFGLTWQILTLILDFLAIGWFGIWMALSLRQPRRAAFITVLVCVIVPTIFFCIPNLAIDALILVIAHTKVSHWIRPRSRPWESETRYDWPVIGS
jgi:ABC-type transport system involved in multi-copper enzyme maturation permease subunit